MKRSDVPLEVHGDAILTRDVDFFETPTDSRGV